MDTTTEKMRGWLTDLLIEFDLPNNGIIEKIQSDNEFKGIFTKLLKDNSNQAY